VPVVSLALVYFVGAFWMQGAAFDPNTAAQNPRIRFAETADPKLANLPPNVAALASAVVDPNRSALPGHLQLLFLGNSQNLAIMDWTPGDLTTPQWLQVEFAEEWKTPVDVRVGSLPNMTPTEYLIRLVAAGEHDPTQVDVLLLMTVLEEFRDLSVRSDVAQQAADPAIRKAIEDLLAANPDLPLARQALEPLLGGSEAATSGDAPPESVAASIETAVQDSLNRIPLFRERESLLGSIYVRYYDWRNRLLGISSSSTRRVPDDEYQASMQLLELCLKYAESNGSLPIVYLTPLRPVQPNPNLPADVARYKTDVKQMCADADVTCLDYSNLVPEGMWTNYPDQPESRDFAHFTGPAHKLVADRLWQDAVPIIRKWAWDNGFGQ
jgi:hypothetical protein